MLEFGRFQSRIIATRDLPGRPARHAPIPASMNPRLAQALEQRGITQLYTHQAEMFERAVHGENLVITTGTASGKSLAFLLPVVQALLADPTARAILLYPTKALSHDQLRALVALIEELAAHERGVDPAERPLEAGVFDGDTPPLERKRVRERAHLVLTNPDMLNTGLLPAHGRPGYTHLFRHVKFVVVDEMHIYRGAFGAHVSNVMRRLLRVCAHYGSQPQFLCSSATIANPAELAEKLCHRRFGLIDDDGSPSAGRRVYFWLPPLLDNDVRKGIMSELAAFVPHLIRKRYQTIAFCRSRKQTEVVLKEARDRLSNTDRHHDESRLLAAYRGGYTPIERRKVEQDLIHGRLLGVISTNALELGIDIGALEVVVQGGFPGTRASFWQQIGRAGRRGHLSHAVVMLDQTPEDQYIAADPDWLTGQAAEHAVVDPDNLTVQLAHVRAACAELPLTLDDVRTWPDLAEVLPVLAEAGEIRSIAGAFHWTGGPFPAGEFSLRRTDGDRFKVVDRDSGKTLTEMTRPQTYKEAHPRAIYLHDGQPYLVDELDLVSHTAHVKKAKQNFYTQPDVRTHIDVLLTSESQALGRSTARFGDVRVDDSIVGYKMLEFHNHQNLGYEALHEPLSLQLETEAVWWDIPSDVLSTLGRDHRDAVRGMVSALRAMCRLHTMAEGSDLAASTFAFTDETSGATTTGLVCYDQHPGGIGFAAKAYDLGVAIFLGAIQLLRDCRCKSGCPACTGDVGVDKRTVLWGLRSFFEALEPPRHLRAPAANGPAAANADDWSDVPFCGWGEVAVRWGEVRAAIRASGDTGSGFFDRVSAAVPRGERLALQVHSAELARWANDEATAPTLEAMVRRFVAVPDGFRIRAEVSEEQARVASRKALKLRRRLEDFKREESSGEQDANERLASGFVLPEHQQDAESASKRRAIWKSPPEEPTS